MSDHEKFLRERVIATAGMYVGARKAFEKHVKLCTKCRAIGEIAGSDCPFGVSLVIQMNHSYEIMTVAVEEYQSSKITQEVNRI